VIVHLIDGTYELYRQFYGSQRHRSGSKPNSGVIGVLNSTLRLIEDGATHLGVATDHSIESFRNDLWPNYKSSDDVEPEILRQIPILEELLRGMGVTVWSMTEFEADDALASAARVACEDRRVHQVQLVTPDKDLGQCVSGRRVVQVDRRNDSLIDEVAIRKKLGIGPESIVDFLALVGDAADGFPGVPGWGPKSASALLARYGNIMSIPGNHATWETDGLKVRGAERLATSLQLCREEVEIFRILATLVDSLDVGVVDDWQWMGPLQDFRTRAEKLDSPELSERAEKLRQLK